jgi:hypothetical protein
MALEKEKPNYVNFFLFLIGLWIFFAVIIFSRNDESKPSSKQNTITNTSKNITQTENTVQAKQNETLILYDQYTIKKSTYGSEQVSKIYYIKESVKTIDSRSPYLLEVKTYRTVTDKSGITEYRVTYHINCKTHQYKTIRHWSSGFGEGDETTIDKQWISTSKFNEMEVLLNLIHPNRAGSPNSEIIYEQNKSKNSQYTEAENAGARLLALSQKGYISLAFGEPNSFMMVEPKVWNSMMYQEKVQLCQIALTFLQSYRKVKSLGIEYLIVADMTSRSEIARANLDANRIEISR